MAEITPPLFVRSPSTLHTHTEQAQGCHLRARVVGQVAFNLARHLEEPVRHFRMLAGAPVKIRQNVI